MIGKDIHPAFPSVERISQLEDPDEYLVHSGLNKREYFAGQMLAALAISTSHHFQTITETVECAVDYADALLAELAKPIEGGAQ